VFTCCVTALLAALPLYLLRYCFACMHARMHACIYLLRYCFTCCVTTLLAALLLCMHACIYLLHYCFTCCITALSGNAASKAVTACTHAHALTLDIRSLRSSRCRSLLSPCWLCGGFTDCFAACIAELIRMRVLCSQWVVSLLTALLPYCPHC
jgi:hypothetical protein